MNRHSHDGGRTWHQHDPGDGLLAEALGASRVIPLGGDPPHRLLLGQQGTAPVEWYGVSFAGLDPVLWPKPMTALPVDDPAWFDPGGSGSFDPADDLPTHGTYRPDGRWRPGP